MPHTAQAAAPGLYHSDRVLDLLQNLVGVHWTHTQCSSQGQCQCASELFVGCSYDTMTSDT